MQIIERGRQDQVLAHRQVLGSVDPLLQHADEVVDVVQAVVLDVERVPPEPCAVREQDTLRVLAWNVHKGPDGVGPVADVHRLVFRYVCDVRVVHVPVAGRGQLRSRRVEDLQR